MALRILVGDDQADVRDALRLLLKSNGYLVQTESCPEAVLNRARQDHFDLALLDMNYMRDTTSGREGIDLITSLRAEHPELPIVVMTAWGSVGLAVEAMQHGAVDFVEKPWSNQQLLDRVARHSSAFRQRTEREVTDLQKATAIQQRLLQSARTNVASVEAAGHCLMHSAIGGDAYDVFDLNGGSVVLALADVSGKGTGAALLMAHLLGLLRTECRIYSDDLVGALSAVNRGLFNATSDAQFATLFLGVYNSRTGVLRYINCGHPPALIARNDQSIEKLSSNALMIGLFSNWQAAEASVQLNPGEVLLLYSDGATEACNDAGLEFGEDRLAEVLKYGRTLPVERLLSASVEAVRTHCRGTPQDDVTMLAFRPK